MNAVQKKYLGLAVKLMLVACAGWFIYFKLADNRNLAEFKKLVKAIQPMQIWAMVLAQLVLMLTNWLLEARKWQVLMARVLRLRFWPAVQSVFCGLTLAIFTPNRLGEYGGRVFFLPVRRRVVGVMAMAIGSIGQMVVTVVMGSTALCYFIFRFLRPQPVLMFSALAITLLVCIGFLLFYFNISWLAAIAARLKWLHRLYKTIALLNRYNTATLLRVLGICALRYMIFSFQYFAVFMWLIPGLHATDVAVLIFIMLFIQSLLPSLDLFDVGVRSFTAVYFFNYITGAQVAVMACTAAIWFINIILPAILGTPFVFRLNLFGNTTDSA